MNTLKTLIALILMLIVGVLSSWIFSYPFFATFSDYSGFESMVIVIIIFCIAWITASFLADIFISENVIYVVLQGDYNLFIIMFTIISSIIQIVYLFGNKHLVLDIVIFVISIVILLYGNYVQWFGILCNFPERLDVKKKISDVIVVILDFLTIITLLLILLFSFLGSKDIALWIGVSQLGIFAILNIIFNYKLLVYLLRVSFLSYVVYAFLSFSVTKALAWIFVNPASLMAIFFVFATLDARKQANSDSVYMILSTLFVFASCFVIYSVNLGY